MKTYHGMREGQAGAAMVFVDLHDGEVPKALTHRVCHSPDGFQWSYGGSGPADLARSLLWDVMGAEPDPDAYQAFKAEHVAKWAKDAFRVSEAFIAEWIVGWEARVAGRTAKLAGEPVRRPPIVPYGWGWRI